ncbi:MAG: hypothetical protein ACRC1P_04390 [Cellulosilyticaceae bacterium]
MNTLLISSGGNKKYTNHFIQYLDTQNLYTDPNVIFFTFHLLEPIKPTHHYYIPTQKESLLDTQDWNTSVSSQLTNLIQEFNIEHIIFIGHYVYSSLLTCMKAFPSLNYIWLKPPGSPEVSNTKREKYFDQVTILSPDLTEIQETIGALKNTPNF